MDPNSSQRSIWAKARRELSRTVRIEKRVANRAKTYADKSIYIVCGRADVVKMDLHAELAFEEQDLGLAVTPDFLGHKMIDHGGSIAVSTAYMAFVPDLEVGVVMMGNSSGMDYATIAESVFAILMGKDLAESIPGLYIRERMKRLMGSHEVYRGLERLKVVSRGGLLYLETKSPRTGTTTLTPLIPEDPTLASTDFYTVRNGLESPIKFVIQEDGAIDLFIGRY